jgi:hypothetical protein
LKKSKSNSNQTSVKNKMKNQIQIQKDNIRIYGNQATEKKQSDLFKQSKKV